MSFKSVLITGLMLIATTVIYIRLNSREKAFYEQVTGRIAYLDKKLDKHPGRNIGTYRYLIVEGYSYPFEIFVGNDPGDFKPEFEEIDRLNVNDTVTVFFYQTENTEEEKMNRFAQFIDKDHTTFYKRGDSQTFMGMVIVGLCIAIIIGTFFLARSGRIDF
jgi:hypothetical protein